MGAVFAMQGVGQLTAALLALITTAAYASKTKTANAPDQCDHECKKAIDSMWRIVIGFGAVPGCIALYYRLTIPETPRYTFEVSRDAEKAAEDVKAFVEGRPEGHVDPVLQAQALVVAEDKLETPKASWADFLRHYGKWRNLRILIGTAGSWLLLDVAFYGLGLNNSVILKQIGFSKKPNVHDTLWNNAIGNIILICAGAIPGYWVTVGTVDTLGRKPIQMAGFVILTILFFTIGFAFNSLSVNALLALYVLCQFFFNFGPNATTFIVPGECFPTRYRSTSHGVSAASGKIGAILAQVLIGPLRTRGATPENDSPWLNHVMQIFAGFMAAGIFTTLLIPETKRKTLEDLNWELYGEGDAVGTIKGEDGEERIGERVHVHHSKKWYEWIYK